MVRAVAAAHGTLAGARLPALAAGHLQLPARQRRAHLLQHVRAVHVRLGHRAAVRLALLPRLLLRQRARGGDLPPGDQHVDGRGPGPDGRRLGRHLRPASRLRPVLSQPAAHAALPAHPDARTHLRRGVRAPRARAGGDRHRRRRGAFRPLGSYARRLSHDPISTRFQTLMKNPKVIALDEHYFGPHVTKHFQAGGPEARLPELRNRLFDVGELRIREMDEAGIDVQVLSHAAPATQRMDAETAIPVARRANDRLLEIVKGSGGRFEGFAALPTADPKAAADELERAVSRLGFKGAMIHGLSNGQWLDDKRFWPIFERAQALDVPVYMHPAIPHPAVADVYYKDYLKEFPGLLTAGWGFTVETATQAIRMVLSGMFEAYPGLKIILGHLGEGLPFSLWRIDMVLGRQGNRTSAFRDCFREHFWITTSGNFPPPALLCSVREMGPARILFSVDSPFVLTPPGVAWMRDIPLGPEDRAKIYGGNARRLLRL